MIKSCKSTTDEFGTDKDGDIKTPINYFVESVKGLYDNAFIAGYLRNNNRTVYERNS